MQTLFNIKFGLFYLSILFFLPSVYSQNVQIETTSLQIVNKKLEIRYDIQKAKKTQRFDVSVEITNLKGDRINAKTFSGDIGSNQMPGKEKVIIWDYNADGILLNEEINVDVLASVSVVAGAVQPGKALLKSLVFPGWGLTDVDKGKPYWLLGVVGYGSVTASLMFRSSYKKNYDEYLTSDDNSLLDKSESQEALSRTFGYVAIGTWAVSAIWTLVKANKVNSSKLTTDTNRKLYFYSGYDPRTKSAGFTLKYNF